MNVGTVRIVISGAFMGGAAGLLLAELLRTTECASRTDLIALGSILVYEAAKKSCLDQTISWLSSGGFYGSLIGVSIATTVCIIAKMRAGAGANLRVYNGQTVRKLKVR